MRTDGGAMDRPKIVYRSGVEKPLTFDEYSAVLTRASNNRSLVCTNGPLYRPEGGTIVIYDCRSYPRGTLTDNQLRQTFRVDGYRWGHSKGVHLLKNGLEKRYYCLFEKGNKRGDFSFIRTEYSRDVCGLVLFHYIGDHVKGAFVSDNSPHGNAKKSTEPYSRSLPAVLQDIKRQSVEVASPLQIFEQLRQKGNNGKHTSVVQKRPRNKEQVRNALKNVKKEERSFFSVMVDDAQPGTSAEYSPAEVIYSRRAVPISRTTHRFGKSPNPVKQEIPSCSNQTANSSLCSWLDGEHSYRRRMDDPVAEPGDADYDEPRVYPPSPKTPRLDPHLDSSTETVTTADLESKMELSCASEESASGGAASKFHLLIAVASRLEALTLRELIDELYLKFHRDRILVRVMATDASFSYHRMFKEPIYDDVDELQVWRALEKGKHEFFGELREWADGILVVPLDAHNLAKIANGLADNLLTMMTRSWDPKKPFYFAPGMTTAMWENPITAVHRRTLSDVLHCKEILPKEVNGMSCSGVSSVAMASVKTIASFVAEDVNNVSASTSVSCSVTTE